MVERKSFFSFLPHVILALGILVVAFPVYVAFVASTWDPATISNGTMPLRPGPYFLRTTGRPCSRARRAPRAPRSA